MNPLLIIPFLAWSQIPSPNSRGPIPGQISADLISVRGLPLGAPKSKVLSVLGKPMKSEHGYDSDMGMGHWEKMFFPGLVVEVTKPDEVEGEPEQKEPHVWRMAITGKAWVTQCGLRIGQTREQVIAILGPPASEQSKGSAIVLNYIPNVFDGFIWVELRNGYITEIGYAEDWS